MDFHDRLMLTTTDFSRRLLSLIAAAALVLQAACTVEPATGKQGFTGFMSVEDKKRIGAQEHPRIMRQFGGA